jgi:oligopeptide transport system substrate-binding protein
MNNFSWRGTQGRIQLPVLAGLSLVLAFSLAACNNNRAATAGTATSGTASGAKDAVQELTLVTSYPYTFDVNDARNANEFLVMVHVFEGLFNVNADESGNTVYSLAGAESYEVSSDGLVWTFHLRDTKWSDGTPVTAQQYVDSIKRLIDPREAFSYANLAYDIIAGAEAYYAGTGSLDNVGVRAINDKTLEITLKAVDFSFDRKLAFSVFAPIRLDLLQKAEDRTVFAKDPDNFVYNGAFIVTGHEQDSEIILEKNPNYWDAEHVYLNKVTLLSVTEVSTQATLFEAGQLDAIAGLAEYVDKWASSTKWEKRVSQDPANNLIVLNNKTGGLSGVLKSQKVRLALSLAYDREGAIAVVYNRYTPAYGYYPYGIHIGEKNIRDLIGEEPLLPLKRQYDTNEKLQALFQEGLADIGINKPLSDITITFLRIGGSEVAENFAEFLQQTWQQRLGIKVALETTERAMYIERRSQDLYDILPNGWGGDFDNPSNFSDLFLSTSGFKQYFGWYNSPKYDAKSAELVGVTDEAKLLEIFKELERILIAEEVGTIATYYSDTITFVHNYLKGFTTPAFGADFNFMHAYISGR